MYTYSSLSIQSLIFKLIILFGCVLFSAVIQTQVVQAYSTYSSGGHSGYSDPCDTSDSHTFASAVSRPSYCTNHGSADYGSSVTSRGSGYSYYEDYANNDTSANTPTIKSDIDSLLDRIKVLNDQIKNGNTTSEVNPLRKNDIREVPKVCSVPTQTLSLGSSGGGVWQLQDTLSKSGYFKGGATGYFGEKTREAVRSFQKSNNLVSSGDERSTGYGMVGEKTRGLFKKHCEGNTISDTRIYGLSDVSSVSYTKLSSSGAQKVQLSYEVTLKDGTKRHFESHGSSTTSVNPTTEKVIKNTGYTGVIAELLAKAVEAPKQATTKFRLKDVKTVTATPVDPSDLKADDEYTEYTVTLKDARTINIKGHAGRGTEEVRYKPFRDAGYRGNVETLLKTATPKVLGATTSSAQILLREVEENLVTLRDLF